MLVDITKEELDELLAQCTTEALNEWLDICTTEELAVLVCVARTWQKAKADSCHLTPPQSPAASPASSRSIQTD